MIFKFKNGYQVQIRDCGDKTREELIEIAKKAVEDAVKLEKNIDTNTSFMPTRIREAIKNEDQAAFEREYDFLVRDLDADLTEAHKNYPNMYRKEVIDKLIKQYEDALRMIKVANNVFYEDYYTPVEEKLNQLKDNWNRPDKRYRAHIEYANGEVTVKDYDDIDEARRHIETRIEFAKDGKNPVKLGYVMDNRTGEILKEIKPGTKVTDDIPPYRVKITYANGEVTVKYVEDLTAAVRDIRHRIEVGKEDGNEVAVALVFDSMTDEIVLSSDKDEDIRITDDNEMTEAIGYIEYVDLGAREKHFDNIDDARAELQKLLDRAKKVGEPVARALILNADTEDIVEEVYKDKDLFQDADVKDAPPPYYDPTDYPTIKSNYSPDRLKKEIRHMEKSQPMIDEFNEVIAEIDELIGKGTDALIEAGWSKDDARRAIAARYMDLEKELRRNKELDLARQLHTKIRALEKAWDLRV